MASKIAPPKDYSFMLPISYGMGLFFGLALEKGRVFEPTVIVNQFLLSDWQMMKMFLSAVTTSSIAMSLLSVIPSTKPYFDHSRNYIYNIPRGIVPVAVGSSLLGVGMALAGACPGTVIAQLGAGVVPSALYVMAGALGAVMVHTIFYESFFSKIERAGPFQKENRTVDKALGFSYAQTAIPLAGMLALCVFGLEYFFPWTQGPSAAMNTATGSILTQRSWPPWIAGMIIGSLQIPAILLLKVTIGSATSYATTFIEMLKFIMPKAVQKSKYMSSLSCGIAHWQPTYLIGALTGAFLSSFMSNSFHSIDQAPSPIVSLLGGACLLLGSRIAGGCTSGHGISGFGQLASNSFIAVPAMFGAAIITANVLKPLGVYQGFL